MKRNLLKTLCVALIATFSAVAAWGEVTWYPLTINGVQVTSENCDNLASISGVSLSGSGDIGFKYVPESNTLIMKGVRTVELLEFALVYTGNKELKVQVRGKNQLNSQVRFYGPTTIEGDGLLEINETDGYTALLCQKNVSVKDCKIKASGRFGIWIAPGVTLRLDNAVVVADGTESASFFEGHLQYTNVWTTEKIKDFNSDGYAINEKGEVMKHLEYVDYDPNKVLLHEDFESGNMPEGWVTKDHDGDGEVWKPRTDDDGSGFHGSRGMLWSKSWWTEKLTPLNGLISLKIEGANRIRFHVCSIDNSVYFQEHYWLYYTTSDDIEDDQSWEELEGSAWTLTEGAKWFRKEFDLPEGTKYVGMTHGYCGENRCALMLDDIIFFGKNPHGAVAVTPADEKEATIVGYYTIDGRRHNQPQSGVNIVKMSNGKAKKVLFP